MDLQQGTPAWFAARRNRLTASNFGAAAGVNPYASRNKALKQLRGEEEFTGNAACTWGTVNEPNAVTDYMIRTGNVVRTSGFHVHPHYSWLGGSPDGLVGERGMIEVKCPYKNMEPHAGVPVWYYCQVNGLMEILDRDWCDFVTWTPQKMRIYRVYRDTELFNWLFIRYQLFYACMKRGTDYLPNQTRGEKAEVMSRIEASNRRTRHDFWDALDPNLTKEWWPVPPYDLFMYEDSDEGSDGTSPIRKLRRLDCATRPATS